MKLRKSIFSKLIFGLLAGLLVFCPVAFGASSNLSMPDVGDFGNYATENNRLLFTDGIKADLANFELGIENPQTVKDFVPIEAKLGLVFMNALSFVGKILDNSLIPFAKVFIILMYCFWIMFETYDMMKQGKGNLIEFGQKLVMRGAIILAWLIVLDAGITKLFMTVMTPVIGLGTYLSDFILNSVTSMVNFSLPDTCAAITQYAQAHTSPDMLLAPQDAANILCVPTRLSGFFYTGVAIGAQWMLAAIGTSFLQFFFGLIFVGIFLYNIYKFAISAFGVIADLFLGVLLLPFTAISECIQKTSLKGIPGDIFNGFMGLFNKAESLSSQIARFVNAMIYFVSLSIIISVCALLLSLTISESSFALDETNFLTTILIGSLTAYLGTKAGDIAKDIGGSINDVLGKQIMNDTKNFIADLNKKRKSIISTIAKSKE